MRSAVAAFTLLLLLDAAARAGSYDDFNAGIALRNRDQFAESLPYLSSALAAPDLPGHLRAPALLVRGLEYQIKGDFKASRADYTAAIALSPKRMSGYIYRAGVEEQQESYTAAIEDYSSALNLKPYMSVVYSARAADYEAIGKFAEAETDLAFYSGVNQRDAVGWFQLGFAQWAQGHFDQALINFERSRDLDKTYAYAALWREITQENLGKDDSTLPHDNWDLDNGKWPSPVVDLYLGKTKPDDALAAAEKGDSRAVNGQKCEAAFYVGEWQLLRKDSAGAQSLFGRAATSCEQGWLEKMAAAIELARLKGTP